MCGLCGTPAPSADWVQAGVPDTPEERMRARHRSTAVLSRVGRAAGVTVRDGLAFGQWTVATPTGRTGVAMALAEVWPMLEALADRPGDPLDPVLLARLDAPGGR